MIATQFALALVESSVLAAVALALRRHLPPAMRGAVLTLALLKFATPPALQPFTAIPLLTGWSLYDVVFELESWFLMPHGGAALFPNPFAWLAAGASQLWPLYAGGCAIAAAILGYRFVSLRRLRRRCREVRLPLFEALRGDLRVRLLASDGVGPYATGVFRPAVIVPATLLEGAGDETLRLIFAHELTHIQRRDVLRTHVESWLLILWWVNPLYWMLRSELRAAREEVCDDAVLASTGARPEAYCDALLCAAAFAAAGPAPAPAMSMARMERRLRRLFARNSAAAPVLAATEVVLLIVAALLLLPGFAYRPGI